MLPNKTPFLYPLGAGRSFCEARYLASGQSVINLSARVSRSFTRGDFTSAV